MNEHVNGSIDRWDVIDKAAELARNGEEFALATVVWRQGPSSGQQGARAIITAAGERYGWIGGACAEPIVVREAHDVIRSGQARLLLLGAPEQFGAAVPEGMAVVPISCQSEGAMEVFIEPVVPAPHLLVVGRSPMAHTLTDLATDLGWRAELTDALQTGEELADIGPRTSVVIATQGHGDEEAVEAAVSSSAPFVGLVASRKRGEAVRGYLADRGVPRDRLDRVRVPVGLDLGHTSHREIAVAVLAELVRLRAAGELVPPAGAAERPAAPATATDPICGMTVTADTSGRPIEHDGVTYYFCCPGCHDAFERDPGAHADPAHARQEV
jgi:xanthine dehydrogenase accessory factor